MTKTIASSKINCMPSPFSALLGMVSNETILDKFLDVCQLQPDSLAIRAGNVEYTYQSLNQSSDSLAAELITRSNHNNKVVAIYGKRSATLIVTMLACLKAGFTFAVLGHAYPKERLKKMASIIAPSLIVGIETGQVDLEDLFDVFEETPKLSVTQKSLALLTKQDCKLPACTSSANDIAYLLFTSGTTGLPKCIQTSHQPLVHFIDWYRKTFEVSSGRQFSMFSGLGHDPVLRDIFVPLSTGGILNIPDNSIISNPNMMFDWIQSSKIEYMHVTPQLLRLICAGGKEKQLPDLRYVFCGGDVLRSSHSKELKTISSDASLVNFYGATETPQAMGYHVVDHLAPADPIPIGVGISDVQLLVMTEDMQLAKPGEKGQIGIRTHFLSKGYLNDIEATSSQFITSPFTDDPDDRIYLTGDYGYFQEDWTVVGLGRIDDQVKIRGFRVELLEVTTALESHPLIQNAIILANKAPNGESRLAAYLVRAAGVEISEESLELIKSAMSQKLPDFMIPSHFLWIDTVPLLPNGKLDREKLPSIEIERTSSKQTEGVEGYLINEWKYILGTHHINPDKSFVELGGDSLSFIQASMVVEKAIGRLPVDWEKMPLKTIANQEKQFTMMSTIGSPIIIRALSILLIVIGHFNEKLEVDCTTTALFIVAGWSIGKYQLNTIIKTDRANSIIAMIISICIPTILYTIFLQLWRFKGHEFHWESVLLYSNFIDFNIDKDDGYNFWFIMVLVQALTMVFILFSFKPIRELVKKNAFKLTLTATIIFFIFAVAGGIVWDTGAPIHHRVPHLKIWLLFFGMSIALADTKARTMMMNVMTIGIFWVLWNVSADMAWFPREALFSPWEIKNAYPWFPLVATLFIINMRRVNIPKPFTPAINLVAGASLFIYLMNMQFYGLFKHTPIAGNLPLTTLTAISGSILIWKIWDQLAAKLHMLFDNVTQKKYSLEPLNSNKKEDNLIN